ncbi:MULTISPECIES: 4-hydroxybenzoate octaprenyltransferase [Shewanella]|jgi:4-hydroxybenzoate polyprenyltransferase|uniref:4-hydroxybenzoate octaprenyltransferase n=4 Tax=Shewanella TaxID=22 RepID=UBIA_SHESW|nr:MULTISPECIES: 4-hydroxybenzoate octaprenyltransferase [Shewanella]A1RFH5.1 RecName: Full=4-hydroxybenzoate octaprenyltransferase; AltName: Full=4-HB polyprenyltransferase [Shewanella sp. W3-18-1]A4YAV1.1 RecName: Full=4-hydroxybenzoate octaprenyltransferase; AltName: Full=4-HB polyprenyltransferase [Shewanella putrefaciens CN-32]CAD6364348.1 4-hydroxybenzoate octaprenyltransferase [Shewanella hafniensis]ABM23420.1 4-hydroxybenzoate octaprenyltransferase [Shewanella sp. W3-18-1]AVV85142.1 4-
MNLKQKWDVYSRLTRLDRPIGTLLLMWPCLMALMLAAGGMPDLKVLIIFIIGVVIMRACGCIINDYADRDLDSFVERTKSRPLASGEISTKEALILFVVLGLSAFGLVLLLNGLVVKLSVVGIILTIIYPFTKRITNMPQMFLGVVWSWSIPMAYAAQTGEVPMEAWWLFAANWFWTVAYDTMYAMVDRDDDLKVGIKSTAILFGKYDRQIIGLFQIAALVCFIAAGWSAERGLLYGLGLLTFVGFSTYQQMLIFGRERAPCFKAFLNNNWAGLALFVGLGADYLI